VRRRRGGVGVGRKSQRSPPHRIARGEVTKFDGEARLGLRRVGEESETERRVRSAARGGEANGLGFRPVWGEGEAAGLFGRSAGPPPGRLLHRAGPPPCRGLTRRPMARSGNGPCRPWPASTGPGRATDRAKRSGHGPGQNSRAKCTYIRALGKSLACVGQISF
jgi:hypothetical protein